jgi:hypothetical protein
MMHPDDGKITKEPIQQEFIRNKRLGHNRLIFRTLSSLVVILIVIRRCGPSVLFLLFCFESALLKPNRAFTVGQLLA